MLCWWQFLGSKSSPRWPMPKLGKARAALLPSAVQGAAFHSQLCTLPASWPASNPDKKCLKIVAVSQLFCDLHEKSEMTSGLVSALSRLPTNRGSRKALVLRPKAGSTSAFLAAAPLGWEGGQQQADSPELPRCLLSVTRSL